MDKKSIKQKVADSIMHLVSDEPDLQQRLFQILCVKFGMKPFDIKFLASINYPLLHKSKSQLRQDLFVLHELGYKKNGYFVEFGATDGVGLSNTWLLEKCYSWNGIVAEPATCWHEDLIKNRSCYIETDCVWSKSGEILEFSEVKERELSTISNFSQSDNHAVSRQSSTSYKVNTISLGDLLNKYNAPPHIDYLSIDTEGSEYEILSNYDFGARTIQVITCEHNFTPARQKIFDLLTSNGYVRKHENISSFDDWYVLETGAPQIAC